MSWYSYFASYQSAETGNPSQLAEQARKAAWQLLRSVGITQPPVPIERLARLKGVTGIVREKLGNIDALLLPHGKGFMIKVNSSNDPRRQSFSIAHEIAHLLLSEVVDAQEPSQQYDLGRLTSSQEEGLCHTIASELLMPQELFEPQAMTAGFSLRCVRHLARIFHTSITATVRRLTEVMPEPAIAIFWGFTERPGSQERKLRVKWSTGMKMRHPKKGTYLIPAHKSVSTDSSVFKAYHSEEMLAATESIKLGNLNGTFFMESQGFGTGPYRFVASLIYLNRR
jgi:Zn-dependent peptidase ImmA (M78 family)